MQSHLTYVCRTRISRLGLRFCTILPWTSLHLQTCLYYYRKFIIDTPAGRFWYRRRGEHSETEDLSAVEFLVSSF